jgi:hypothetical protein
MKRINYIILVLTCLSLGILFFLIQHRWLIIHWTFDNAQNKIQKNSTESVVQKKIQLYYWKNEKLQREDSIVICNLKNKPDTLKQLANSWLDILKDEKIFTKKMKVEYIALDESEQNAYISLNQTPPWQEWSINQKWLTIESLLKTIREANLGIKYINLLVQDKPLEDTHLSFMQAWPIEGFEE